jgi:hypothetical protein
MNKAVKPIIFHEIDKQGNHVLRITGGDNAFQESLANKMGHAEAMLIVLKEAKLQIEYLHGKFKATGSGNQVLAKIESVITDAESIEKMYKELGIIKETK